MRLQGINTFNVSAVPIRKLSHVIGLNFISFLPTTFSMRLDAHLNLCNPQQLRIENSTLT